MAASISSTAPTVARTKSRVRPAPLEYGRKSWLQIVMMVGFIFLYFPMIALVVRSFNEAKIGVAWKGFSLKWYVDAYKDASLFDAVINSLIIAFIATAVSTVIGATLGLALYRYRFPFKGPFDGLLHLPIVIPEICMAVAALSFFALINLPLGFMAITISHIAFCFPFVAVVVRSRMAGFDESLEEASRDLGASPWQTFWNVTVPYMMPGVVAGALLAFTLSLDDFVITFFTSAPGATTFPVKIYSMVRQSVTPKVNAASTILIVITLTLTMTAMLIQSRAGKKTVGHG